MSKEKEEEILRFFHSDLVTGRQEDCVAMTF